jgi:membrane protein DedA with SNARE-associated domain
MATLQSLIENYGYVALVAGTLLEGETVLVLGGITARMGYLELPWVYVAGFAGSLAGDQIYFYLGRRHKDAILSRFRAWQQHIDKVDRLLEHHPTLVILSFRFLYGLRTVTPFVIGTSKIPTPLFILLNVVGAAVWSVLIASLGWLFGNTIDLLLGDIRHYEMDVLVLVALGGGVVWVIYFIRRRRVVG